MAFSKHKYISLIVNTTVAVLVKFWMWECICSYLFTWCCTYIFSKASCFKILFIKEAEYAVICCSSVICFNVQRFYSFFVTRAFHVWTAWIVVSETVFCLQLSSFYYWRPCNVCYKCKCIFFQFLYIIVIFMRSVVVDLYRSLSSLSLHCHAQKDVNV